jgi:hypothetical protein
MPVADMTSSSANPASATLLKKPGEHVGPAVSSTGPVDTEEQGASAPSRSVYRMAARELLPYWLRAAGQAPWLRLHHKNRLNGRSASTWHREQLAALAIGLLTEFDARYRNEGFLHEWVRTSLIRWQLSLGTDGRPVGRRQRRDPLHGAVAASVIQLLADTSSFQTGLLLADVERHMTWLAKRRYDTPWLEASAVCALADGALISRDTSLLTRARARLRRLLACQDEEGWFRDPSGPDVGRLSLIVDALARVHRQTGWEEVADPLRKALRFLLHFVHPDGSVGGCYNAGQTPFFSPYGVELLASDVPDAAALALVARRQCARLAEGCPPAWPDDPVLLMGSRVALAAAHASATLSATYQYPCDTVGTTRFPHAGLTIFSTRAYHAVVSGLKGGAFHATWRDDGARLEDAGVMVAFARRTLTSNRWDLRTRQIVSDSAVTCGGVLRRVSEGDPPRRRPIGAWVRRLVHPDRHEPSTSGPDDRKRGLAHDRFCRSITFGEDSIRIRDSVRCRLPARAIVCQSAPPGPASLGIEQGATHLDMREPLLLEGGRDVEITRVYRNGRLVDQPTDQAD